MFFEIGRKKGKREVYVIIIFKFVFRYLEVKEDYDWWFNFCDEKRFWLFDYIESNVSYEEWNNCRRELMRNWLRINKREVK